MLNIYKKEDRIKMLEMDIIDEYEDAFMQGYNAS